MPKSYRTIQQWNHWLTQFLGKSLLDSEKKALSTPLTKYFGRNVALLGVPHQHALTSNSVLFGPLLNNDKSIRYVESVYYELPILSGSIDHVILPHTLEFVENPHQVLLEACRIVRPEGHIFILGFNPYSFWGIKRYFMKHRNIPWSGNFINAATIKKWLALADFELEKQDTILFRPPTQHQKLYQRLKFLEWLGKKCYKPFGGVYLLQAKAKTIPLTPIRLHWTQELSGARMSINTIPGPSIRNHP